MNPSYTIIFYAKNIVGANVKKCSRGKCKILSIFELTYKLFSIFNGGRCPTLIPSLAYAFNIVVRSTCYEKMMHIRYA